LDPLSLIPLANLVEVRKYKLGEIVLREGENPHSFFIISAGRVKVIKEEVIIRSNFSMGRGKKFSNKAMRFGNRDCKLHLKSNN
jgi:CRP-like cAMP-binding protein